MPRKVNVKATTRSRKGKTAVVKAHTRTVKKEKRASAAGLPKDKKPASIYDKMDQAQARAHWEKTQDGGAFAHMMKLAREAKRNPQAAQQKQSAAHSTPTAPERKPALPSSFQTPKFDTFG